MEDELNFSGNGRQPQFFRKWKMISISGYGRGAQFSGYGRGPKFLREWKMTSSLQAIENNLKWKTTSIQYQLFLLANVDSKFPIKNNFQLNQSQPSLT